MNAVKYIASIFLCNLYRFLRIFPNNDPITGVVLVNARREKLWKSLLFPIITIFSFDFFTSGIGLWTFGGSLAYVCIALIFRFVFKRMKEVKLLTYAKGAFVSVLIFDFITGPIMSGMLFRMPFEAALMGQIPFTIAHLASAVMLTIIIAPVLDPDVAREVRGIFSIYRSRAARIISAIARF